MARRKPSLEDYVDGIIARDNGMPYEKVLKTFGLTSDQFAMAISRDVYSYIQLASDADKKILTEILNDKLRKRELLNMGEIFLREQYNAIEAGIRGKFSNGTFSHPENIKTLVYYVVTSRCPELVTANREKTIETLKKLPSSLAKYLHSIGLGGLMNTPSHAKHKRDSPLIILEIFDSVYQEKRQDKSLFDLSQKTHLHEWDNDFKVPHSYWKNPANVKKVVYHKLTEEEPKLASKNRREVITAIKNLPYEMGDYFKRLGLNGLMDQAFSKSDSRVAVLKIFDEVYQEKTRDASLFDLNQQEHLHPWGDEFRASFRYWQNTANVEEAIYHALTESHPELKSDSREKVIYALQGLPTRLQKHLNSLGLGGLTNGRKITMPAVLEIFDKAYQNRTGKPGLFDKNQAVHLEIDYRKPTPHENRPRTRICMT